MQRRPAGCESQLDSGLINYFKQGVLFMLKAFFSLLHFLCCAAGLLLLTRQVSLGSW
jgi:hypothetical protein